jgi:hypothetical protein
MQESKLKNRCYSSTLEYFKLQNLNMCIFTDLVKNNQKSPTLRGEKKKNKNYISTRAWQGYMNEWTVDKCAQVVNVCYIDFQVFL